MNHYILKKVNIYLKKLLLKKYFRDTISYILKDYSLNNKSNIRKDYIKRTLNIVVDIYRLNSNLKYIDYNNFILNLEIKLVL